MNKRIVFKNSDSEDPMEDLGTIHYEGHTSTPIPGWEEGLNHPIYISKQFEFYEQHNRWKVNTINFLDENIEINLTGVAQTKSLGNISDDNSSTLSKIVSQYNIVEVDFGHHGLLASFGARNHTQNKYDCDINLPGELHKRRPCIVLQIHSKTIQVLPLSTQQNSEPHSIEISPDSFKKLNARYSKKPSYTLPHMITSVSGYRVYPPSLPPSGQRHYSSPTMIHSYKLSQIDRARLKESLASQYAPAVSRQLELLRREVDGLKNEKKKLLDRSSNTRSDLEALRSEVKAVGLKWGESGSTEEILKKISPD